MHPWKAPSAWLAGAICLGLQASPVFGAPADYLNAEIPSGQPSRESDGSAVEESLRNIEANQFDAGHLVEVLAKVDRAGSLATRGAKEAQIFRTISPSVVLIVAGGSLGSGSIVGAGSILTNWHVVGDAAEVGVIFKPTQEGREVTKADIVRARVVKIDEKSDLALLAFPPSLKTAKAIELGTQGEIEVGADVHAIGHPTGEAWTYTRGVISQFRKGFQWQTEKGGLQHSADVIQTQTPINPGNSGGPLLSDKGHLLGVNSFKSAGEGLNFAVAVEEVKKFIAGPAPSARKKAPPGACEMKILYKGRNNENTAYVELADTRCTGKGNVLLTIPDDKKRSISLLIDTTGSGKPDIWIYDVDRDGKWDYSLHSSKRDGKIDLIGFHPNGELEPSRYEQYRGQATPWAN